MAKWMFWVLTLLVVLTGCFVFLRDDDDAANDSNAELLKLRQEKLEAAKKWFVSETIQYGGARIEWNRQALALKAICDSQLDLCTNKQDRIKAWKEYIQSMESILARIFALREEQSKGGEEYYYQNFRYLVLDAKCQLQVLENTSN